MLVLLTLATPVAVLALLLTMQWYEYRWLGGRKAPTSRAAPPAKPRLPS